MPHRRHHYSTVAQSVEQAAVNRWVAGSSPACGAIFLLVLFLQTLFTVIYLSRMPLLFFLNHPE